MATAYQVGDRVTKALVTARADRARRGVTKSTSARANRKTIFAEAKICGRPIT